MNNLSKFRKNEFIQLEYSLATGRSVSNLLDRSKELNGNTQFNTFLLKTSSSKSPIDWLEYDQSLNANIAVLKFAAKKIVDLEQSVDLNTSEILKRLKGKYATSCLGKLFKDLYCDYWSEVTKSEIIPLLNEFNFWLQYIDGLELCGSLDSAEDLLVFLEQPLFKQLKRLVDVVEVASAHWGLDVGVFENIIKGLRDNNGEFVKEWLSTVNVSRHFNVRSNVEYKSFHSWMFLSIISQAYGYKNNLWATKRQWQELGCELKEDAKPAPVFHFFKVDHEPEFEQEEQQQTESSFGRKISIVYNADGVIGFDGESYAETKVKELPLLERRINQLDIHIEHTDDEREAAYHYIKDFITMPNKELFKAKDSTKAYYATLLHEMVHWTGHEKRCKRTFGTSKNDSAYAFEELVAEIGSSFLCTRFGLTKSVRTQSINYIAFWLEQLNEKQYFDVLEKAATLANRASNYIYVPKRDD